MTDDIKAIRDALVAGPADTAAFFSYLDAVHPERIARLLDALGAATRDAERWRYVRDEEGAHSVFSAAYFNTTTADELDAAIDAALKRGA